MDGWTLIWMSVGLGFLALASAFISAVETAFFSIPPSQLEALKARKSKLALGLAQLLENPRRLLGAILFADALANAPLMIGCIALLQSQHWLRLPFWQLALVVFALIVFVCDLVPKLFALGAPRSVARLGVPLFRAALPLLDPLTRVLENLAERLAAAVLPASLKTPRHLSEEELETLVELSTETGALHETESEMISEIIKLGDKTAKDCMTPRVEMFSLPDDLTNEEAAFRLRQRRFRRVPVYGETPDDLEGILDVAAFLRSPDYHYTERLELPSFIPETMKAVALLKNFLSHSQGLAVVVDEHGGVEGIVSLADLVEEIISDAVPHTDARIYLEPIGEGRLLANGNARLEDLAEELGLPIDGEGIDTIGGLIFNHLGQLPKAGQKLSLAGMEILVRRVSRKRVEEVLITHQVPSEEEEES